MLLLWCLAYMVRFTQCDSAFGRTNGSSQSRSLLRLMEMTPWESVLSDSSIQFHANREGGGRAGGTLAVQR